MFFKLDTQELPKHHQFSYDELKLMIKEQAPDDLPCPYCQVVMNKEKNNTLSFMTIDHINPLSKSADNSPENLTPVCRSCNGLKSNQLSFSSFRLSSPQKLQCAQIDALITQMKYRWQIPFARKLLKLVETEQYHLISALAKKGPHKFGNHKLIKFIKRIDGIHKMSQEEFNELDFVLREKGRGIYFTPKQIMISFTKHRTDQMLKELRVAIYQTKDLDYGFKTFKVDLG